VPAGGLVALVTGDGDGRAGDGLAGEVCAHGVAVAPRRVVRDGAFAVFFARRACGRAVLVRARCALALAVFGLRGACTLAGWTGHCRTPTGRADAVRSPGPTAITTATAEQSNANFPRVPA